MICLAPFAGKAFHIDDPQFLWTAKQVLMRPWDFYGFGANWYGLETPMWAISSNPPLIGYLIAPVAWLTLFDERALHVLFMLPAVAAMLGVHALGSRLSGQPILTTAIALSTPVFVVSATTLMADVPLLACWVWAVVLWMRGIEEGRRRYLVAAAVLVALAALTKYYGVALIPLLAAWTLARGRQLTRSLVWLAIPIGILAAYELYTIALYQRGLLSTSMWLSEGSRGVSGRSPVARGVIGLAFTGGGLLTAALYAPLVWPLRRLVLWLPVAAALTFAVALRPGFLEGFIVLLREGVPWTVIGHLAVFVAAGVLVLALVAADLARRRDADALLLALWTIGGFVFAAFVNSSINGRSILVMTPAVAVLVVRTLQARGIEGPARTWSPVVAGLAVAMVLAWADAGLARDGRMASDRIRERHGHAPHVWFQGHWGFQFYMEAWGARAVDGRRIALRPGDVMVVPENNANTFVLLGVPMRVAPPIEIPSARWLTTMHRLAGAGFYSDFWGPLPFAIGPTPPERYRVLVVQERLPGPAR